MAYRRIERTRTPTSRRDVLMDALGLSAGLGILGLLPGCAPAPTAACPDPAGTPDPAGPVDQPPVTADTDAPADIDAAVDTDFPVDTGAPYVPFDLAGLGMPYRQDDPVWSDDLMWDRELVIRAATELDGVPIGTARSLMRWFPNGNSIGNEGCMLTCLAMALRLLAPDALVAWTPRSLNRAAHELYYYTLSGLSMTTLYADIVSEVTVGKVQLALKEEYLPGVQAWPKVFPHTSALLRAWRSLTPEQRAHSVVMLKLGTYDDTVASHYVLVQPDEIDGPDDPNPLILDPAMPHQATMPWRITDSSGWITTDPAIGRAWTRDGIEPNQIGGVWVFTRWNDAHDRSRMGPLVRAWGAELAR